MELISSIYKASCIILNCFRSKILISLISLLLIQILINREVSATTCIGPTDATTIKREQNSYTGFSSTETYSVKVGLVSNALYYSQKISSPSRMVVRKINQDSSAAWMAVYSADPVSKSLAVDQSETNVYDVYWTSPLHVLRIDATAGTFISAQQL